MTKISRFVLGLTSSLLLAAGLARAADRLDPMSRTTGQSTTAAVASPDCTTQFCDVMAPDCTTQFCDIVDEDHA